MNELRKTPRVLIIGSGFSGLCVAIGLVKKGVSSFTILEKADRLGGTWRENTYPGAACDLPSFAYCFSFEQKSDWSRKWSPQPEILEYMEECATKYRLQDHVRFGTEVQGAHFDEARGVWRVRTRDRSGAEEELEAELLVSGVGQLHKPLVPKIPGLESFDGDAFHSAEWDHDVELRGKRVAVIGTGASAVQFIPEIAPGAERLTIFQRTPNWLAPRGDRAYTDEEKSRFERHPWFARLYRWFIWARQEMIFPIMIGNEFLAKRWRKLCLDEMALHISDPELIAKLTPDYPVGGKRVLIHDTYYPALARDDVDLETTEIDRIEGGEIVLSDDRRIAADVIIFATGFDTNSFQAPMQIEGLDGRLLEREWKDGAEAYYGITVSGFPNFFMMYGPNTNLGHNSIIFMIECQTNYILSCFEAIWKNGLRYLDVKPEVQREFNARLHSELAKTAWAATSSSWYKTDAGKITNNWAHTTISYWWRTRRVDFGAYRQVAG